MSLIIALHVPAWVAQFIYIRQKPVLRAAAVDNTARVAFVRVVIEKFYNLIIILFGRSSYHVIFILQLGNIESFFCSSINRKIIITCYLLLLYYSAAWRE